MTAFNTPPFTAPLPATLVQPRCVPTVAIDLRLYVPADAPMITLVQLVTDFAEQLDGWWEYHAPLSTTPGRFELHGLTLSTCPEKHS